MIASIFYNQVAWHNLLCGFIRPYIQQNQNNISHWRVSLSTYRGEHITVEINPANEHFALKEDFCKKAEAFLENFPSPMKAVKYPLDGLFMDYPNNTIEYDIEEPHLTINDSLHAVKQQLSEIILYALADQEIDIESIFTLIVYLQFGIIKAGFTNTRTARVNTLKLVLHLTTHDNGDSNDKQREDETQQFVALFDYNKEIFVEIIEDIWTKENYETGLHWMAQWENACKTYLQTNEFHVAFMLLSQAAYQQTGLNGDKILLNASKQILKIFNQVTKKMDGIIRIA
ncbi:hypothetical protein EOD41_13230 [Mucilaginibacter limnophilus]|uniref:Thiopeptide-type bacteriocin biosynthesis domain-containing protein n=1 Tax=Mucilaginibacter limnophilus TaxID=1932778 RepID=A0A437MS30_9SPHI|nr:hypothetical protein [Mucilaginibacter limnophilus]RVU00434.1 hypothetical protein EOD41_13230 [Mucilaginibacter limnophilus]